MLVEDGAHEGELFGDAEGQCADLVEGADFAAALGFFGEARHARGAEVAAGAFDGVRVAGALGLVAIRGSFGEGADATDHVVEEDFGELDGDQRRAGFVRELFEAREVEVQRGFVARHGDGRGRFEGGAGGVAAARNPVGDARGAWPG